MPDPITRGSLADVRPPGRRASATRSGGLSAAVAVISMVNFMTVLPHGLRRGFAALGVRNYRLYWTGQVTSRVGTWMQQV